MYPDVMAIDVRLPTVLRPHADGVPVVNAEGSTIGEVFTDLIAQYPGLSGQLVDETGALHKFVNVYLDDEDVRYLDQLDTKVSDGAEISILPAVAGG